LHGILTRMLSLAGQADPTAGITNLWLLAAAAARAPLILLPYQVPLWVVDAASSSKGGTGCRAGVMLWVYVLLARSLLLPC
jgi:hypothetical protein